MTWVLKQKYAKITEMTPSEVNAPGQVLNFLELL